MARLLLEGKIRAEQAVSRELLRTYYGIGQLLDRYLLGHQDRAGYGEQAVARLAQDVGLSRTLLYQTLTFYCLKPILHARGKLA